MALKTTINQLRRLLEAASVDLSKAEGGNKAASQRVRTGTIKLEKIAKLYRKESISDEKKNRGKPKKRKAAPKRKAATKRKAAPKRKAATKRKAAPKRKTTSKSRTSTTRKRATAKIPSRRRASR